MPASTWFQDEPLPQAKVRRFVDYLARHLAYRVRKGWTA